MCDHNPDVGETDGFRSSDYPDPDGGNYQRTVVPDPSPAPEPKEGVAVPGKEERKRFEKAYEKLDRGWNSNTVVLCEAVPKLLAALAAVESQLESVNAILERLAIATDINTIYDLQDEAKKILGK